jgi:non-ribosomal peptide synthetase component E (peptide arylation enzyme)
MDYAYVLRVAASKFPTRRAVLSRDGMVTFADLDDLVDRTARALARILEQ